MKYLVAVLIALIGFGFAGSAQYCEDLAEVITYQGQGARTLEHGTYERTQESLDLILNRAEQRNEGSFAGMIEYVNGVLYTIEGKYPLAVFFSVETDYYCVFTPGEPPEKA